MDDLSTSRTLEQCITSLGPELLYVACAPRGLDLELGELIVLGAGETVPPAGGGLMLLVGGSPSSAQTVEAVGQAAGHGYIAVAVKEQGQDASGLAKVAERSGLALLVVPDDVPWRHLNALLSAMISLSPAPGRYDSVGMGDLFSLANAVAASVGGAVTIEDPRGQILAYSNLPNQEIDERRKLAILGRQTPERPQNTAEYRQILQSEDPVRFDFDDPEEASRLAVAVRAGNENLGVIFALDTVPPLPPGAGVALEEAAKVAALHLLRARSHRDPERWSRSEALRSLLDDAVSARLAAGQMALDPEDPTVLLAVTNDGAADTVPSVANARITDLVSLYCAAWHDNALCTAGGDVVYALLPVQPGDPVERRRKFADEIASALQRSAGLSVSIGIGPLARSLDDVPTCRRLTDRVLGVLRAQPDAPRVATVEDLRSQVILSELREQGGGRLHLLPGPAQELIDHDEQHGTSHGENLLAYLEAFGDVGAAAARLTVHENTLRYRIRRIRELFPIDLDDPDQRLLLWLQLRLARTP